MSTDITFQVRSNEQLLFLLKLVDVNQIETKRRNVNVRHKIWKAIAEKLNRLSANGAEKDGDGWKRCFKTWRLGVGPDYKMKMQELLKKVPSDGNYIIKVSDDEAESEVEAKSYAAETIFTVNPVEKQKQLLHELVVKHKNLLLSTADDKPLKERLWYNIAEQLNSVPGALTLTPLQWKQSVDLEKYRTKRGRKPMKAKKTTAAESHGTSASLAFSNEKIQASTSIQNLEKKITLQNNNMSTTLESIKEIDKNLKEIDNDDENLTESDSVPSEDDDSVTSEPKTKRPKPSPLTKNFKFSNRMVNAVEQLRDDVQCVNNSLKETADSLASIQNVLERQCEQQDEFNALLKRSTQLLKVLVEFKIGKRTSITKRNFHINHETEST